MFMCEAGGRLRKVKWATKLQRPLHFPNLKSVLVNDCVMTMEQKVEGETHYSFLSAL